MYDSGLAWGKDLREKRPEVSSTTVETLLRRMYRSPADFVYSVSRDFVRGCQTPLLVLPGNDRPHPHEVGVEVADLALRSARMDPWKDAELIPQTVERIRGFLRSHTPATAAR